MILFRRLSELYAILGPQQKIFWLTLIIGFLSALWNLVTVLSASAFLQSIFESAQLPWHGFLGSSVFSSAHKILEMIPDDRRVIVGFVVTASSMVVGSGMKLITHAIGTEFLNRFMVHLQINCFERMLRYNMNFHDEKRRGELTQLIMVEVRGCHNFMKEFTTLSANGFTLFVYVILMWLVSPVLTGLGFLSGIGWWVASSRLSHLNTIWSNAGLVQRNNLMTLVQDGLYGVKHVKLLSCSGHLLLKIREHSNEAIRMLGKVAILVQGQSALVHVASLIVVSGIVAGSFWSTEMLPPSVVILFLFISILAIPPVSGIARLFGLMRGNVPAVSAVVSFFSEDSIAREVDGQVSRSRLLKDRIVIDDVSLNYPNRQGVIQNLSLEILYGERLGIVGQSGSGKTSLVNMLLRLYDPSAGRILIDGTDIRDFQLSFLRSRVGMVSQDSFLFNGSVEDNIRMGKHDAPMEEIIAASKLAHAHEFVSKLPNGYETLVGDRGSNLSGGQRQRLAIAQVFLRNPEVLLLDEGTSSLDPESEALIHEAIESLSEDRTVIVVAHRLSALKGVDRLIVLEGGMIVEQGTWADLAKANGVFARTFMMQESGTI